MQSLNQQYNQNLYYLSLGPFGTQYFSVTHWETHDLGFNQNYSCDIYFRFNIQTDLSRVLYQPACLHWGENYLHGIVTEIYDSGVKIASKLYLLNKTKHSRIYADLDFKDLITQTLITYNFKPKLDFEFVLNISYPVLSHISQYQETDLEFINRLCSRWGIGYCFVNDKNKSILVFFDKNMDLFQKFAVINRGIESFNIFKLSRKLLPKTVKIADYNFQTPEIILDMQGNSSSIHIPSVGTDNRLYEFYQTREWGKYILKIRLEYYDCNREIILAETGNLDLKLGQNIKINNYNCYISQINFNINILENKKHINLRLNFARNIFRPELPVLFHMPDCTARIISQSVDNLGCYFISPDYDENSQNNFYPVRLARPTSGNNYGFHFPLPHNTRVFISHINGDPDRPVIIGVMPEEQQPNTVTNYNFTQHILRTPQNSQWFMEDEINKSAICFNTRENQAVLNIQRNLIQLGSYKDIMIHSDNNIIQKTHLNFYQNIGGYCHINIKNNYKIISHQGNIHISSGKKLVLASKDMGFITDGDMNISSKNTQFKSQQIIFKAGNIIINSQNNLMIKSNILNIKANQKIIFAVGNSVIILGMDGIVINAKTVHFNTPVFASPPAQLGVSGAEFYSNKFDTQNFKLKYINLENNFFPYSLYNNKNLIYSGAVRENMDFNNIDINHNLKLHHPGLAVINIDGKSQKPSDFFEFKPRKNHTHKITLLKNPVYKNISKIQDKFECELLTNTELDYFKNQKYKNIIIFIHGYDIETGVPSEFGYIRTPKEGFNTDQVNGTGGYNWLLHMEYNFNCAIKNSYLQYPWEEAGLDYTRIIGVHWPGYQKVLNIPYSDDLNYSGMEFNAIGSGYALIKLIQQLKDAGLNISVVAHSLGAMVIIQLLDLLGRNNQCFIDQIILWQAAIANTALSPVVMSSMEEKRDAVVQTVLGELSGLAVPPLLLYGYYGEYLRQKTANFKNIPLWELYELNPFAYFPYAHRGAKNIHVLTSQEDMVLKTAYQINTVLESLPHLNFIHEAMGITGVDEESLKLLKNKVKNSDQQNWLEGHSEMRIPSKVLFENVYKIITRELWEL